MSEQDQPQTLAILLGVDVGAGEDKLDPIKAAYIRYKQAAESGDIDEEMAAFRDYLELGGGTNGQ